MIKNKKGRALTLLVVAMLLFTAADFAHASVSGQKRSGARQKRSAARQKKVAQSPHVCPMHPEVTSKSPGVCPKCNMKLVPKQTSVSRVEQESQGGEKLKLAANNSSDRLPIPDTLVYDQHGKQHKFYTDLVKGKTVAINFIFTTCRAVCPTLTAKFRQLQQELGERVGKDVQLISISVDPTTDVPERLSEYAAKFKVGAGWTFVTGSKPEIDRLLRALGGFAPDKNAHPQMILIGNEAAGYWTRVSGIAATATVAAAIGDAASKSSGERTTSGRLIEIENAATVPVPTANDSEKGERQITRNVPAMPARATSDNAKAGKGKSPAEASAAYFPNLMLTTQDNKPVRFYDDLLKGKVVLINFLFTTCKGVCSPMTANLAKVQSYLGDRVGRDVTMISITVDPLTDTVPVLKRYADGFKVKPGWYFLTGKKENIDWVLYKLGGYVEEKTQHSGLVVIGNEATGEWTKAPATSNPSEIASAIVALIGAKKEQPQSVSR